MFGDDDDFIKKLTFSVRVRVCVCVCVRVRVRACLDLFLFFGRNTRLLDLPNDFCAVIASGVF